MAKNQRPAVGLAEIMRRNGIRQADVTRALGTTRESVRLWCAGRCRPRKRPWPQTRTSLFEHQRRTPAGQCAGACQSGPSNQASPSK